MMAEMVCTVVAVNALRLGIIDCNGSAWDEFIMPTQRGSETCDYTMFDSVDYKLFGNLHRFS